MEPNYPISQSPSKARADHWISDAYPALTRNQVQEAFKNRWIQDHEGRPLKKGDRIESHQWKAESLEQHLNQLKQGNPELKVTVLADDADYWVIDKPAGMPSHPLRLGESQSVTHWALAQNPALAEIFSTPLPLLSPHRLDTGTSGVLIVAKTPEVYERFRNTFAEKIAEKKYLAWCWGTPVEAEYEVDMAVAHDLRDASRMVVVDLDGYSVEVEDFRPPILPAQSKVKVLEKKADRFLAEVSCETGVTHQVRVHLAHLGFPVVGDEKYDRRFEAREWKPEWHQLRAIELSVPPDLKFQASPEAFQNL